MRLRIKESPQEIERKFNQICRDINRFILREEDSQIPPQDLFQQLDDEFENVKKKYKEQNDVVNLLHATHNYLHQLFQSPKPRQNSFPVLTQEFKR